MSDRSHLRNLVWLMDGGCGPAWQGSKSAGVGAWSGWSCCIFSQEEERDGGWYPTHLFLPLTSVLATSTWSKSSLLVHPLWRWLHSYSQRYIFWVISKSSQATMERNPHTCHDLHCWMHIRCPSPRLRLEFPLPPFKTLPLLLSLFMSLCLPWNSARFKTMVWYIYIIILFNKKRIFSLMSYQKCRQIVLNESKCHKEVASSEQIFDFNRAFSISPARHNYR